MKRCAKCGQLVLAAGATSCPSCDGQLEETAAAPAVAEEKKGEPVPPADEKSAKEPEAASGDGPQLPKLPDFSAALAAEEKKFEAPRGENRGDRRPFNRDGGDGRNDRRPGAYGHSRYNNRQNDPAGAGDRQPQRTPPAPAPEKQEEKSSCETPLWLLIAGAAVLAATLGVVVSMFF